jgi:hypothetical protein
MAKARKRRLKKLDIALSSFVLHPSKDIEIFGDNFINNLMMFVKDDFGKGSSIRESYRNPMILLI